MTEQFNRSSYVVCTSILAEDTVEGRAAVLSLWLQVAKHLSELRNFNSLLLVCAAMGTTPIYRLKNTWALVSKEDKASLEVSQRGLGVRLA